MGTGCSSVDSVPAFEAVGRRIDPSQWTQLQFGLFSRSNQWSTTGLSKATVVCSSVYGKVHIKHPYVLRQRVSF